MLGTMLERCMLETDLDVPSDCWYIILPPHPINVLFSSVYNTGFSSWSRVYISGGRSHETYNVIYMDKKHSDPTLIMITSQEYLSANDIHPKINWALIPLHHPRALPRYRVNCRDALRLGSGNALQPGSRKVKLVVNARSGDGHVIATQKTK